MLTHSTEARAASARVVILGAGGFLGGTLIQSLRVDRVPMLALGRKEIDLSEDGATEKLAQVLKPNDTVVFLSAITRDRGRDSAAFLLNLKMGRAVCAAVAAVKPAHLIYASSDAVYPFTDAIVTERSAAAPVDFYGTMHRAREIMLAAEAETPLAVLRFTAVYGAGDAHHAYGPNRFINQALSSGTISLFGDGEETRDHLYVDDAIAILRKTIARASTGLLNVCSGSSVSFRAVAEMIAGLCSGVTIATLPRHSAIAHRQFDIADTRAAFPALQFTSIRDGLRATICNTAARPNSGPERAADRMLDI